MTEKFYTRAKPYNQRAESLNSNKKLPKGIIFHSMPLLPIKELYSFISEFYSSLQDRNQIKWMLSRNILPHHQEQSLALLPGILICGWDFVTLGYGEDIQPCSRASEDNKSVGNIHESKKKTTKLS